jgi:prolipoprotein diacylglyceryltransferase
MPTSILSRSLDRLVRPTIHLGRTTISAFQFCGYIGLTLAIIVAMTLTAMNGLSYVITSLIVVAAVLTFLTLAMATKILLGEERLIYYHHEIAVMSVATLLLLALKQPPLPYLDITILGIGSFLVCGRIGCLMVGCCHGRPNAWGVAYGDEHKRAGFPSYYVGVRLFPSPLVEAVWVLFVVAIGIYLTVTSAPGATVAWYVLMYDLGRFSFEFLRGDAARPYLWGFSEAQWISLFLMFVVVGAEFVGILPFQLWHSVLALTLASVVVVIFLYRKFSGSDYRFLQAGHVAEMAQTLQQVSEPDLASKGHAQYHSGGLRQGRTSLGVQIVAGTANVEGARLDHYSISNPEGAESKKTLQSLVTLVWRLRPEARPYRLIEGNSGVLHVLLQPGSSDEKHKVLSAMPEARGNREVLSIPTPISAGEGENVR